MKFYISQKSTAKLIMLGIISKYMRTLSVPTKKKKSAAATTAVKQGTAKAHYP